MSSLTRTTLRHMSRRRARAVWGETNNGSFSTLPQVYNGSTGQELPAEILQSEICSKDVKLHLVQTLENVVRAQKDLSNLKVIAMESFETDLTKGEEEKGQEYDAISVIEWKDALIEAVEIHDPELSMDIFHSAPENVDDHLDSSFLHIFCNLMYLLLQKKGDADCTYNALHVMRKFQEVYSKVEEHEPETLAQGNLKNARFRALALYSKVLSKAHREDMHLTKFTTMVEEASIAISHTSDVHLQHKFYPTVMKLLLNQKKVTSSTRLYSLTKTIWDNAAFSFRGTYIGPDSEECDPSILSHYETVLQVSTFRKQAELPFTYFLQLLTMAGGHPSRDVAMKIVQNGYPYKRVETTRDLLKTILRLHKANDEFQPDYKIDLGTLQHLTAIPARKGSSQIMTLLWQLIDRVASSDNPSYSPSQGLLENFTVSFASSNKKEDELVFKMLADFEDQGYEASRVFLKSISQSMRTRATIGRLNNALHILQNNVSDGSQGHFPYADYGESDESPLRPTAAAMNCVMSAFADLGLVDRTCFVFQKFEEFQLEPDENTFLFMMEALAMNLTTAIPPTRRGSSSVQTNGEDDWITFQVETADVLFEEAIQRGMHANKNMCYSYVQVLLATGRCEKAKTLLEDTVLNAEKIGEKAEIDIRPFSLVAIDFAKQGDFDQVEYVLNLAQVAGFKKGFQSHVSSRIDRLKEGSANS
mmetsp:Transcript_11057/g.16739  ORF Transcript_11057/g.16739 Transcript_11057/m.16739 type:complete len:702 (+) Transcript_11057:125-2230(+)